MKAFIPPYEVGRIAQHVRKVEGKKKERTRGESSLLNMPILKSSKSYRLKQYATEFKGLSVASSLHCQTCGQSYCIKAGQRSQLTDHLSGNKYTTATPHTKKKK